MCGIAGIMNIKEDISNHKYIIKNMVNALRHRGPDTSGFWESPHLLLGHTRLIVVDPNNGKQPMIIKKNNNTYVIAYNGELYNTQEIRNELKQKNYSFKGTSDTEVLLNAYIEWKENYKLTIYEKTIINGRTYGIGDVGRHSMCE